jgi:hypothetical protein
VLEVVSEPFEDDSLIWQDATFPCRVRVKKLIALTPETGVPIHDLRDRLSIFRRHPDPRGWGIYVRRSPTKWTTDDGNAVVDALIQAEQAPVTRPVKKAHLRWRPKLLRASNVGMVTVPDQLGDEEPSPPADEEQLQEAPPTETHGASTGEVERVEDAQQTEVTQHTEIQWGLLKLRSDMGLDVWVARNDRNRLINGHRLSDVPRIKERLPVQFDDPTTRTIELIDVLWLRGNAIVAAFEVESTTSIYSGLLRMSDLLAMQPNLNIPLYLVAPDERTSKVLEEVNRPTFSRLNSPLNQVCRLITFSALRKCMVEFGPMLGYLRPEFIQDKLSESCRVDEA